MVLILDSTEILSSLFGRPEAEGSMQRGLWLRNIVYCAVQYGISGQYKSWRCVLPSSFDKAETAVKMVSMTLINGGQRLQL